MAIAHDDLRYPDKCVTCKRSVGYGGAEWSKKKFGKVYCWDCRPRTIKESTAKYQKGLGSTS